MDFVRSAKLPPARLRQLIASVACDGSTVTPIAPLARYASWLGTVYSKLGLLYYCAVDLHSICNPDDR